MSPLKSYLLYTVFCINCIAVCFTAEAQKTAADSAAQLSVPGPANQDTTKFATLYVMRPGNTIASTFWMGIYFDNTLIVRVDNAMRYIIKYAKTGDVKIWVKNPDTSVVTIKIEPNKKYYLQLNTEAGGKTGITKLEQLNEKEGEDAFNKIKYPPLYVYDPDPYTNSKYIWPSSSKTGYEHMQFSPPLSTRHYFVTTPEGFIFSYYNKNVSTTFTEVDGVYGLKMKFSDKEDFDKYAAKQTNNIKKSSNKNATIESITEDSLTSGADYTYSVYFVEKDNKPNVETNGVRPVLELRQCNAILYEKDPQTGKGDVYSIYFSERGLTDELHSKEEIKFKIQQLLNSCEFGKAQ